MPRHGQFPFKTNASCSLTDKRNISVTNRGVEKSLDTPDGPRHGHEHKSIISCFCTRWIQDKATMSQKSAGLAGRSVPRSVPRRPDRQYKLESVACVNTAAWSHRPVECGLKTLSSMSRPQYYVAKASMATITLRTLVTKDPRRVSAYGRGQTSLCSVLCHLAASHNLADLSLTTHSWRPGYGGQPATCNTLYSFVSILGFSLQCCMTGGALHPLRHPKRDPACNDPPSISPTTSFSRYCVVLAQIGHIPGLD